MARKPIAPAPGSKSKKQLFGKPSVAAKKVPPKKPGLSGDTGAARKGPPFRK